MGLWGAEGCVMPNYRWLCACKHKAIWQYVWVCVWVDFCLCMYTVLLSCHDVCSAWLHSSVRELSLSLSLYIYIYMQGYTARPPGIWSGQAGWRAAWRWRAGTRWAFAAGKPPASRSHGRGTQTPYSAEEWGESRQRGVSLTPSGRTLRLQPWLQTPPRTGACYII